MSGLTLEQIGLICADYRRMKPPQDLTVIAQLNGVTVEAVRGVLIAEGFMPPNVRTRKTREEAEERREAILALAGQGLTIREAAARLGATPAAVRSCVLRMGLEEEFASARPLKMTEEERRAKRREYRREWARQRRKRQLEEEMRCCGLLEEG